MKRSFRFIGLAFCLVALVAALLASCGGGGGGSTTDTRGSDSAIGITAFSIASPAAMGIIDENAKSIAVSVPHDTNVTALVSTFTTTTGASVKVGNAEQVSGTTPNDFTGPVPYTVTMADSATAIYTVTVTVAAIALPKTGQTICSDATGTVIACANTGQDGNLQKGVAWPVSRFTTSTDTSVTDNLTGLAWAPNANLMPTRDSGWDTDFTTNDGRVTWQHALDYVAKLNAENYLGHNDWRLPNVNEMASLINASQYATSTDNPAKWLNTQGFTNVMTADYWTSSTRQDNALYGNNKEAWVIDLYRGGIDTQEKASTYDYVWPVRGGQ